MTNVGDWQKIDKHWSDIYMLFNTLTSCFELHIYVIHKKNQEM